jgi:hypothetical protein
LVVSPQQSIYLPQPSLRLVPLGVARLLARASAGTITRCATALDPPPQTIAQPLDKFPQRLAHRV